jgi:hypothetical protein
MARWQDYKMARLQDGKIGASSILSFCHFAILPSFYSRSNPGQRNDAGGFAAETAGTKRKYICAVRAE